MATIIDPDFLLDAASDSAQNIYIDTGLRTIKVRNNSASGNANKGPVLDNTGVSLQALYSFLKEEWKDDPKNKNLINYPFPLVAITPEQFEFRFGWKPADDSSRSLIRTAGWREYAADNTTLNREYLGVITLGTIDGTQDGGGDKVYHAFFDSATLAPKSGAIDFQYAGPVNEAIQTYGSATEGNVNYTGDIATVFIRQQGKTYDQTRTTDIGISAGTTLPYNVQRFPLSEGTDLDVTVADATITANSNASQKYDSADNNGPTIRFLTVSETSNNLGYTKDLKGAGSYPFGILIDADDGSSGAAGASLTKNELYSWVQYRLRSNSNIEDSAQANKIGKLTDELLEFVGPTLKTKNATNLDGGGTGVAITNFLSTDINDLAFRDNSGTERTFPFTAAGTISFSDEILTDAANAKFFLYYEYTHSYPGSIAISNAGTAALGGTSAVDSATFTLSSFTVNPVTTGVNSVTLGVNDYFKLTGAANETNNQIWKVTNVITPTATQFSAVTYDDLLAVNETAFSGTIRTYPINSPQAVLIDSAGTTIENSGGISATLAPANLNASSQYIFEYDYDGNTQFDREVETSPSIVIRALGTSNGSYVQLGGGDTQTIAASTTNSYSVVSAVERNYSNPE